LAQKKKETSQDDDADQSVNKERYEVASGIRSVLIRVDELQKVDDGGSFFFRYFFPFESDSHRGKWRACHHRIYTQAGQAWD